MKIISLGLISSIIFSIVLARNSSNSKSTTGCFELLGKKPKKIHTMIAEPVKDNVKGKEVFDPKLPNLKFIDEFDPIMLEVYKENMSELDQPIISEIDGTIADKVTRFLRRENDSSLPGLYIRPYEEDYEDMINYIPLRDNYQREQNNAHKQSGAPTPVYMMPEKQELSTIHEKGSNILHEDKEELDKENENESEDEDEFEAKLIALLFPKDREHDKEFKEKIRKLYRAWKMDKEEMKTKPKNKIKCWN
ncbi:erythrocyte membrane antigen 1 [Plasmodium chabaudi chabaudi]|uniref:Erythrocyte membrane antigen 1 n=1 Tax=Plasmodium chabaudi chabaudi TaxID=31271 RepID=Q7YZ89_PLACU|nr:erythrocyte membrane antigen 1 [Plasmodium chabaudi chabaudi]AAO06126.1 PCEMA1-like protein [Plasmodium chabaudi chabaudi]SCL82205.1 erythrocyte membrane antigen 1 [Plasmodium chabaudi chabaudi]VTZ68195.1 erythrocyte membrane antigen 1 [Plasmodium chabaudi chabaudi]|eukprot:XP_016652870.1 erythrocyte membrane antigen 1 [Plasmodium chabaudi chabaudi]